MSNRQFYNQNESFNRKSNGELVDLQHEIDKENKNKPDEYWSFFNLETVLRLFVLLYLRNSFWQRAMEVAASWYGDQAAQQVFLLLLCLSYIFFWYEKGFVTRIIFVSGNFAGERSCMWMIWKSRLKPHQRKKLMNYGPWCLDCVLTWECSLLSRFQCFSCTTWLFCHMSLVTSTVSVIDFVRSLMLLMNSAVIHSTIALPTAL